MKQLRSLIAAALLIAGITPAIAQTFPTVPSNTVIGRTAFGTGPAQAIPFAQITAQICNTVTLTVKGCLPPPGSTTGRYFGDNLTWNAVPSQQIVAGSGVTLGGTCVGTALNCTVTSVATTQMVYASRAAAAALNLSAFSVIRTLGYAAAGDGGGATFKNVGSTAFIDQGLSTCTVAGGSGYTTGTYRGVYVTTGGTGFNTQVTITVSGGAVTAATPTAQSGYGIAVGQVLVANGGNSQIGGTGSGFSCTVTATTTLKASFTDAAGNHWQYTPDGEAFPNLRQFGGKLDWNGVDATATDDYDAWVAGLQFAGIQTSSIFVDSGGYIGGKLMVPRGSSLICGAANKSLVIPYGVIVEGAGTYNTKMKMCDTFNAGVHFIELCDPTIQLACFTSSIRNLDIFAQRAVVANNLIAMVHTNAAQHEGGLSHVNIYAGKRMCTWFEKGYGGASAVTFEHIECSADGANTMMQFGNTVASGLNYGTTIINIHDIILGGPSSGDLQTGPGIVLRGGFYDIVGVHCEAISICITVDIPVTGNNDLVRMHNVNAANVSGGTACTGVVTLTATNTPGNAIMGMMPPTSCTHIVTNGQPAGANRDVMIVLDMIFNP